MKIGALTLFAPMHCNHTPIPGRVLAAWHWKKSITWRWGLNWTPASRNAGRIGFYRSGRLGNTWHVGLNLPVLGCLSLGVQQNLFPRTYPLKGFPLRNVNARRAAILKREQCPECGGWLDVGNECNECQFEAWRDLEPLKVVSGGHKT